MSSRPRSRRRRSGRYTGVWRGGQPPPEAAERSAVQHGTRGRPFRWRLMSLAIILVLSVVLGLFFSSDAFYIHSISVGGVRYLTKEEVFAYADIANVHLFWIDPEDVRQNVMRSSAVADARVTLGWPPNMVQIIVDEREPALVWEQDGVATWIDLSGGIMAQREDRPDLMRISAGAGAGIGVGETDNLPIDIVHGALQLRELLPNLTVLRYDSAKGLGYQNENGWEVWFGTGTDMPVKVLVYESVLESLRQRGIQPGEINVTNPDAPYYSVLWGR